MHVRLSSWPRSRELILCQGTMADSSIKTFSSPPILYCMFLLWSALQAAVLSDLTIPSDVHTGSLLAIDLTAGRPEKQARELAVLDMNYGQGGRPLLIAVPNKTGFHEFMKWETDSSNRTHFSGFCIEVFEEATKLLPYNLTYNFTLSNGGTSSLSYNDIIIELADKKYDAVVGDVTITADRIKLADFTEPFAQSGLVVVVPVQSAYRRTEWAFLRPFKPALWVTIVLFAFVTGMAIWLLEFRTNNTSRGQPTQQFVDVSWFILSTVCFTQREKVRSTLGRLVVIMWLLMVFIIASTYTANLTSILTVEKSSPTITGIRSLQQSHVPIGYTSGSFVRDYLIKEFHIAKERLRAFETVEMYAEALRLGPDHPGGVAAIIEGLPHMQVLLATYCGEFTIVGQELKNGGFGFAFQIGSRLTRDLSVAILNLSDSGELQKVYTKWIGIDDEDICHSSVQSSQIDVQRFSGLFKIVGSTLLICFFIYLARVSWERFYVKKSTTIEALQPVSTKSDGSMLNVRKHKRSRIDFV